METNGGKTQWWLIGLLTTVLLGGGAAWLKAVQTNVLAVRDGQQHQGERLAVLESREGEVRARLERIERKLDKLLERE